MNALASQKLLLIAESELNRAHAIHDMVALQDIGTRAIRIGSFTTSAIGLVARLLAAQPTRSGSISPAWIQIALQVANVWRQWNALGRNH